MFGRSGKYGMKIRRAPHSLNVRLGLATRVRRPQFVQKICPVLTRQALPLCYSRRMAIAASESDTLLNHSQILRPQSCALNPPLKPIVH